MNNIRYNISSNCRRKIDYPMWEPLAKRFNHEYEFIENASINDTYMIMFRYIIIKKSVI